MTKKITFLRRLADLDDDSFGYWALSERIPREDWNQLYKAKAVWAGGGIDYGCRIWCYDPAKAIPILKRLGYTIENEESVLEQVRLEEERAEQSEKMYRQAEDLKLKCSKCGKELEVGSWGPHAAELCCYSCKQFIVLSDKNERFEAGDMLEADKILFRLNNPEEWARRERERQKEEMMRNAFVKIMQWPGEYPGDYKHPIEFPKGEELYDKEFKPNIYGSGIWYVIQPDAIWVIQNNGSDGADWSRNNIMTGGAGAIGKKCPRDPELEALIRLRGVKS